MTQFTASEVVTKLRERFASGNDVPVPDVRLTRAEFDAFADLLEAREKAVPVGYVHKGYLDRDCFNEELYVTRNRVRDDQLPLYTHSAPSDADRLAEALRPFANLLQPHHASIPDDRPIYGINKAEITAGDLRRANEALAAHSAQAQPPADIPRDVLLDKSLREYAHELRREACSAWSAVAVPCDRIDEAKCEYANAVERRLKVVINELADLSATAHPPATSVPDWTDAQCVAFMAVGLRHTEYKKGKSPTVEEIRQGAKAALAAQENPNG